MQKTNVYELNKPESTDFYNVEDFNNNFDVLEDKLVRVENAVGKTTKNLIPYPYYHTTLTVNGITWTDNGDGTVTANGTATENSYFTLNRYDNGNWTLPSGEYTYGAEIEGTGGLIGIDKRQLDNAYIARYLANTDVATTFTFPESDIDTYYPIFLLCVPGGTTVENLTFKPMLVRGSEASEYEPYVKTIGEQLIDTSSHIENKENPHEVTKSQVGLSNVPNVSTNNQTPTYAIPTDLSEMESGEKLSAAFAKMARAIQEVIALGGAVNGIEFQIVDGKLQFRYDTEVWG